MIITDTIQGEGITQPALTHLFKVDFKLFNRHLSDTSLENNLVSYELKLVKPDPILSFIFQIDNDNKVLDQIYTLFNTSGNITIGINNLDFNGQISNELKFTRCKLQTAICNRSYGNASSPSILELKADFTFEKMTNKG